MSLISALCAFLWNRFTTSSQPSLLALVAPDGNPNGLAEACGMDGAMGSAGAVAASVVAPAKRSV